jgi:hypothetical protein
MQEFPIFDFPDRVVARMERHICCSTLCVDVDAAASQSAFLAGPHNEESTC